MESINYWTVLAAMIAGVAAGMLWYADPVFGKAWKRMQGMSEPVKPTAAAFLVWAAGSLVMALTLQHLLLARMNTTGVAQGLLTGLLIAVGITIAGAAPNYAFAKKPVALLGIELGYIAVSILIMSAILSAWR